MRSYTLRLAIVLGTLALAVWAGAVVVAPPPYLGVEMLGNGNVHELDPEGPAARAGLRVGDKVLAVDGVPLLRRAALSAGRAPGETVVLRARRDGVAAERAVVLGTVGRREAIFRVERLVVGVLIWLVGVALWMLRPAVPATRLFFALSQAAAGMLFAEILDPAVPAMSVLTDLVRYLIAPLLLHFFATFPRPLPGRLRRALLGLAYGGYAAYTLLLLVVVAGPVDLYAGGVWVLPRLLEVGILVVALVVLFRPQPAAALDVRRRRRVLIAGMLLGVTPALVTSSSAVLFAGQPVVSYLWTVPALALVPLAFAYAVFKGELGHVDLLLNRSMVYVLLTLFLLGFYTLLFVGLDVLFATERTWGHLVAGAALVLAGSTLFVPMRSRLQRWVDRLFYGGWYDYRTFVQRVGAELTRSPDLRHVLAELKAAAVTMRFQAGVVLWPRGATFVPRGSYGFSRQALLQLRLPRGGALAAHLRQAARPCAQAELRDALAGTSLTGAERALLDAPGLAFWLPLVSRDVLRSVLVVGERQGDEGLDREDRAILATLSSQAAVACENLELLESLRDRLAEVEQVHAELAETQARLAEGREAERLHLARELHDGPVQDLYAMQHELELLSGAAASGDDARRMAQLRETVQHVAGTLREICVTLRPPLLADFGLEVALRSVAARLEEKHPGVAVALDLRPYDQAVPERVQLALFRICQEALHNAVQHAAPHTIHVSFQVDAERLVLEVRDDGGGFVVPERWIELGRRGRLGLLGIAERAEAIGGTLTVRSAPGQGTVLRVVAPLQEEPEPAPSLEASGS